MGSSSGRRGPPITASDSPGRRSIQPAWAPAAAVCLAVLAGCGDPAGERPGDVRRYTLPRQAEPAVGDAARPGATPSAIRYELPAGWIDRGGGGMRLATLGIDGAGGHEVTVIEAAGTLEANVSRWLGQLDPAADEDDLARRSAEAIAAAETVPVGDGQATVVALFAAEPGPAGGEAAGEAILAAVIPAGGRNSLFVKFKGPAAVARRERENFGRFVSSIHWQ